MTETWHPLSTAPRDGTTIELTDAPDGEVWRMSWQVFKPTPTGKAVRPGRAGGIWAMVGFAGGILTTWEEGEDGPVLWRTVQTAQKVAA